MFSSLNFLQFPTDSQFHVKANFRKTGGQEPWGLVLALTYLLSMILGKLHHLSGLLLLVIKDPDSNNQSRLELTRTLSLAKSLSGRLCLCCPHLSHLSDGFLVWSFHRPSVLPLRFWAVLSILTPPSKPVLLGRAPFSVPLSSSTSHRDLFKVEKIYLVNLDSEVSLTVYQLNVLLLGATFILGDENKYNQENRRILVTSVQLVYKSLLVTLISQPKGSLLFYSWRVGLRAAN